MGEETVVLYTAVGVGHVVPMVEFAKLLLPHGLSLTVVIPDGAVVGADSLSSYISRVSSAHPSISFQRLPPASDDTPDPNPVIQMFRILRLSNPLLLSFLRPIRTTVRALVLDFFCTDALDVAADLRLPSYFFFASAASTLAAFLHLPTLSSRTTTTTFRELGDSLLHFPGLPPMPASHLPEVVLDRFSEVFETVLLHFSRLPLADGIIINTFRSLDEKSVAAIAAGLCVPAAPPVYCVGPLIAEPDGSEEKHECLSWLDAQPKNSVVFLCFGSMGKFPEEQLKEIADGLERSGQRFLWVVRSPAAAAPETDVVALLPEGFVSRTAGRGMVVKSWAPQVAVLGHEAVGGFVTHCGWNSVLEALRAGVPMVAWPLHAEQRMNKVYLVEEWGLAAEMRRGEGGRVAAEEVEERVRCLMDSDEGERIRELAAEVKAAAATALADGGESHAALLEVVAEIKRKSDTVYG